MSKHVIYIYNNTFTFVYLFHILPFNVFFFFALDLLKNSKLHLKPLRGLQ